MKRFLSFFLAFLFLAGALPLFSAVYAEGKGTELPEVPIESPETKVFKRKKLPDKSFRITGYTGSDAEISIPPEILGFAVTEIGDGAFSGKEITRVSVPDGVKAIGAGAFENCARLETVVIADSVESIGTSAFKNCTSLTSFSVPARTSVISSGTFSGCTSLKEISLPAEFEKIEADAFLGSGSVSVVYFAGTREQWGKVFIDPEGNGAISAATLCCSDDDGHAFRTVTVAPTCTEDGYTALACTECSEVRVILTFSALGHEYTETVTEPTCTERGFTTHTCSRCGDSYDDTYVEASGHDFGADGNAEKCAVCGEKNPDYKSPVSFRDVPADAYYKAAVDWAVSSGVTLGTSETTFS
ncbi:MAG: leucine-rich repeat domain-containing protein, partial [Clostridia bacterium]|nr:leucine-rich repeat domain-containing protein [Clostridia bacterium]